MQSQSEAKRPKSKTSTSPSPSKSPPVKGGSPDDPKFVDLGRAVDAPELADESVTTGTRVLGADHWYVGVFLTNRGLALRALDRYGQAARDLLDAHTILAAALGEDHDRTINVAVRLAALYDAWQEADPGGGHGVSAEEWRAKLGKLSDGASE